MLPQDSGSGHGSGDAAQRSREAVCTRLRNIRDEAFRRIPRRDLVDLDRAVRQTDDLVEVYAVSVPLSESEGQWKIDRDLVERLMAARKNTRNFGPVTWAQRWTSLLSTANGSL